MNFWTIVRTAAPADLKSVGRDDLLAWILVIPFVIALLFRWGVPLLTDWLLETWAFDLRPYYDLLMSFFVLMAPSMAGMMSGFLLLDERDNRTLWALAVTPMPIGGYLLYRLLMPLLAGFLVTLIGYPIAGLSPIPLQALLIIAFVAALNGPVTALFLASLAPNKVAGFALVKVLNTINMLPVAAYFFEMPWQLCAGIVPAYWPMKMLWETAAGNSYIFPGIAGVVIGGGVTLLFLKHLSAVVHQ